MTTAQQEFDEWARKGKKQKDYPKFRTAAEHMTWSRRKEYDDWEKRHEGDARKRRQKHRSIWEI